LGLSGWHVITLGKYTMSENDQKSADVVELEYDSFFLHARREAIIIFLSWVVAFLWAVPYCYNYGYSIENPAEIPTTFGIPSWLLWGIAMPWLVADIFTTWFCFRYMKDGELGKASDEEMDPAASEVTEATP